MKCKLLEHVAGVQCVLARDIGGKAVGAKEFALFPTGDAAYEYAEAHHGDPLYEVIEDSARPCIMYLDLDRGDTLFSAKTVIIAVAEALEEFLRENCGIELIMRPGQDMQVLTACTSTKTSAHVRVDVLVPSVIAHKIFVVAFAQFVVDEARWPCLVMPNGKGVVDASVYTAWRSFRLAYMVKINRDNPLTPFGASSPNLRDHAVNVFPSTPEPRATLPEAVANWTQGSGSKKHRPYVPVTEVTTTPSDVRGMIDELNTWKSVRSIWPDGIRVVTAVTSEYGTKLRLPDSFTCPYKGAVHLSNKVYLSVPPKTRSAKVICHDVTCRESIDNCGYVMLCPDIRESTLLTDAVDGGGTFHQQQSLIRWAEDYDEPEMRDFPILPIVCVRAGMGMGKTKALLRLVDSLPGDDKCIIITFSRALALKAYESFRHLGFVNYQDSQGEIKDDRVVVCLDSLHRVQTGNFQNVILDEALSILLHFNSTHMDRRADVVNLFELILRQTERAFFVDAAVDVTFVKMVVDYFADAKGVSAHWIRNRHVRISDPPRTATLTMCDVASANVVNRQTVVASAAMKVLELLRANKRVMCTSSTKSFTEVLAEFIRTQLPNTLIKVHHSGTGIADLAHVNVEWVKYDLVICSPSVSAGTSFEQSHFDALVGLIVNGPATPSVDIAVQQLFRVRGLKDGTMFLFYTNEHARAEFPQSLEKIKEGLVRDVALVSRNFIATDLSFFAQKKVDGERLEYDTDRLSWRIILGIVQMSNMSAMDFPQLLAGTLHEDYAIPIDFRQPAPEHTPRDGDLAVLQAVTKVPRKPAFADVLPLLTAEAFDDLRRDMANISDAYRAAVRLYDFQHNVWGVEGERVDEEFYKKIMSSGADEDYQQHKRRLSIDRRTLTQNKAALQHDMRLIIGSADKNIELFKSRRVRHYAILLPAQALINRVLDLQQRNLFCRMDPFELREEHIELRVTEYMDDLEEKELANFKAIFGIKAGKKGWEVLSAVTRKSFDATVKRKTWKVGHPDASVFKVASASARAWITKYDPSFPCA
jgi:hypothetical protein